MIIVTERYGIDTSDSHNYTVCDLGVTRTEKRPNGKGIGHYSSLRSALRRVQECELMHAWSERDMDLKDALLLLQESNDRFESIAESLGVR